MNFACKNTNLWTGNPTWTQPNFCASLYTSGLIDRVAYTLIQRLMKYYSSSGAFHVQLDWTMIVPT